MKKRLLERLRGIVSPNERYLEKQLCLQCLFLAKSNRQREQLDSLSDAEFSGYSQWGEDGIIDWLVERSRDVPRIFVEFGVGNYQEANTRLLLHLRNWRGFVMDGSSEHINNIKNQDIYWRYDLTAKCTFIDCDNVNELIARAGFNGDIGLLSIDVDGNDYWVWQAINIVSPVIVVCEYNALFGDMRNISVPYQPDFQRGIAHHSNLYFGASLPALIDLGSRKGYTFVGTNSNGCNAFFVRNDYTTNVLKAIGEVRSFPSVFRESRDALGQLTFVRGKSRIEAIRHLSVFDFETNEMKRLVDLGELYSEEWQRVS